MAFEDATLDSDSPVIRQIAASQTPMPFLRCPSSTAQGMLDASTFSPPWFLANRQPGNCLGVVTGIQQFPVSGLEPGIAAVTAVPEPSSLAAIGAVLFGWVGFRLRARRRAAIA